jgi:hypothetical protein
MGKMGDLFTLIRHPVQRATQHRQPATQATCNPTESFRKTQEKPTLYIVIAAGDVF